MPAPIKIDRKAVEVLVAALGVREAARKMGINENTVLQWSRRGKWTERKELCPVIPLKPVIKSVISDDKMDINPAQVMQSTLQSMGKNTRIGLAKAAEKGANAASEMTGTQVLDNARSIKEIAGVASIVHGWTETQASVHISCMGGEQPADALEIDVEVSCVPMIEDSEDSDDLGTDAAYDLDSY